MREVSAKRGLCLLLFAYLETDAAVLRVAFILRLRMEMHLRFPLMCSGANRLRATITAPYVNIRCERTK